MKEKMKADEAIDQLLKSTLRGTEPSPAAACVDAETLAAWSDGSLSRDAADAVEMHISNCARCQAMMAAFAKTEPAMPVAVPLWKRWSAGWLVPLAAAAGVALVIWVASPSRPASGPGDQMARSEPQPAQVAPPARSVPEPQNSMPAAAPPAPRSLDETVTVSGASPVIESQRGRPTAATADALSAANIEILSPAQSAFSGITTAQGSQGAAARSGGRGGGAAQPPVPAARWRILPSGSVERSLTDGTSWEQVAAYAPGTFTSGIAPSASVCWLIGRGGVVLRSVDGLRFERVSSPDTTDLASIRATDALRATVTTIDGRVFNTTDGGATWR